MIDSSRVNSVVRGDLTLRPGVGSNRKHLLRGQLIQAVPCATSVRVISEPVRRIAFVGLPVKMFWIDASAIVTGSMGSEAALAGFLRGPLQDDPMRVAMFASTAKHPIAVAIQRPSPNPTRILPSRFINLGPEAGRKRKWVSRGD